jgi:hypothetical protein
MAKLPPKTRTLRLDGENAGSGAVAVGCRHGQDALGLSASGFLLLHFVGLAFATKNVPHFLGTPVLAPGGVSAAADVRAGLLATDDFLLGRARRRFWLFGHCQSLQG